VFVVGLKILEAENCFYYKGIEPQFPFLPARSLVIIRAMICRLVRPRSNVLVSDLPAGSDNCRTQQWNTAVEHRKAYAYSHNPSFGRPAAD
jgi:hypothetical protein